MSAPDTKTLQNVYKNIIYCNIHERVERYDSFLSYLTSDLFPVMQFFVIRTLFDISIWAEGVASHKTRFFNTSFFRKISCTTSIILQLLSNSPFLCFYVSMEFVFGAVKCFQFRFINRIYFSEINFWLLNSGILLLPVDAPS